MLNIIAAYGIPEQRVNAIANMYEGPKAKKLFEIVTGDLQGDTLAPYLFVIVVHYALRESISGK
jgi:hypothetical protein